MHQPVGRILQLRLYPIRPLWSLGAGWAAVCGGLAVAGLSLSPESWLRLLLAWLLVDPLLGMVWDVGVGNTLSPTRRGVWRQLLCPSLPAEAGPVRLLPYTQRNSPSHRLAGYLARRRHWWRVTFWPQAGHEFSTLVAALGVALLVGAVLSRNVLALVMLSVALSWLTALSPAGDRAETSPDQPGDRQGWTGLWRALGEFTIPWLIGAALLGGPSWAVAVLGGCFGITYFGFIRSVLNFRLIGASQAAAALLLTGLRHPLAAGAVAILLMPQWGLFNLATCRPARESEPDLAYRPVYAADAGQPGLAGERAASGPTGTAGGEGSAAWRTFLRAAQPFVLLSMLLAALAVSS